MAVVCTGWQSTLLLLVVSHRALPHGPHKPCKPGCAFREMLSHIGGMLAERSIDTEHSISLTSHGLKASRLTCSIVTIA